MKSIAFPSHGVAGRGTSAWILQNSESLVRHSMTYTCPPRAAVLMVPIDPNDGFFKLAVTLPDDKIPDQPRLRNPEIDGSPDSASACIPFCALGSLSMY